MFDLIDWFTMMDVFQIVYTHSRHIIIIIPILNQALRQDPSRKSLASFEPARHNCAILSVSPARCPLLRVEQRGKLSILIRKVLFVPSVCKILRNDLVWIRMLLLRMLLMPGKLIF